MKRDCDVATNISLTCFKELPWPVLLTCQGHVLRRSTIQLDGLLSEQNLVDKMSLGQNVLRPNDGAPVFFRNFASSRFSKFQAWENFYD